MRMKMMRGSWIQWTAIVLISFFCPLSTNAQTNGNTKESETADGVLESFSSSRVLNLLMPKTVELNDEITIALTVRVEPSFEEEFQYVFLKRRNGEIELIKKRSASGNIRYKIGDIEEQASVLTINEMAKLVPVLESRTSVSAAEFKALAGGLESAVREHERREIERRNAGKQILSNRRDGTRYIIWMAGESKYDLAVSGQSYKSSAREGEDPLVAWVRKLVKEQ